MLVLSASTFVATQQQARCLRSQEIILLREIRAYDLEFAVSYEVTVRICLQTCSGFPARLDSAHEKPFRLNTLPKLICPYLNEFANAPPPNLNILSYPKETIRAASLPPASARAIALRELPCLEMKRQFATRRNAKALILGASR